MRTSDQSSYTADVVIIATGASAKWLGIKKDEELSRDGGGVSACATCDGFFFKNREIAVVGGGDTALEEATYLTKFASKVYLVHRRDKLRASKAMQDRAFKNTKIEFIWNKEVSSIDTQIHKTSSDRLSGETKAIDRFSNDAIGHPSGFTPPRTRMSLSRPAVLSSKASSRVDTANP